MKKFNFKKLLIKIATGTSLCFSLSACLTSGGGKAVIQPVRKNLTTELALVSNGSLHVGGGSMDNPASCTTQLGTVTQGGGSHEFAFTIATAGTIQVNIQDLCGVNLGLNTLTIQKAGLPIEVDGRTAAYNLPIGATSFLSDTWDLQPGSYSIKLESDPGSVLNPDWDDFFVQGMSVFSDKILSPGTRTSDTSTLTQVMDQPFHLGDNDLSSSVCYTPVAGMTTNGVAMTMTVDVLVEGTTIEFESLGLCGVDKNNNRLVLENLSGTEVAGQPLIPGAATNSLFAVSLPKGTYTLTLNSASLLVEDDSVDPPVTSEFGTDYDDFILTSMNIKPNKPIVLGPPIGMANPVPSIFVDSITWGFDRDFHIGDGNVGALGDCAARMAAIPSSGSEIALEFDTVTANTQVVVYLGDLCGIDSTTADGGYSLNTAVNIENVGGGQEGTATIIFPGSVAAFMDTITLPTVGTYRVHIFAGHGVFVDDIDDFIAGKIEIRSSAPLVRGAVIENN